MPQIAYTFDAQPTTPPETPGLSRFGQMLRKLYEQLARVINGRISFGNGSTPDNIAGVWAAVLDTGAANTDFVITHNLLYIPQGWLLIRQSKAGILYLGSVPPTKTQITLRCSVANDSILIFIL